MNVNLTFELSMVMDNDHFRKAFAGAHNLRELDDDEYLDTSLAVKGISVIYRDSQYKKKVRLLVNTALVVGDMTDTDKLVRKLDKRIADHFDHRYRMDDFTLSGVSFTVDIKVGSRANVSAYLKVLQRVGKVKGFSPVSYDCFDKEASFCLSGNSNGIDFLLYDLERAVADQLRNADVGRKKIESVGVQAKGVLRAEVRLTRPKAVRAYADADDVSSRIVELTKNRMDIFMETFTRIVPFGDFHKKDAAMEIIRREVPEGIMRKKMLRLLVLIPEKKSIHLAQKAMDCRNREKVMDAFAKINLSPVTLSKRHDVKRLDNLYSHFP